MAARGVVAGFFFFGQEYFHKRGYCDCEDGEAACENDFSQTGLVAACKNHVFLQALKCRRVGCLVAKICFSNLQKFVS